MDKLLVSVRKPEFRRVPMHLSVTFGSIVVEGLAGGERILISDLSGRVLLQRSLTPLNGEFHLQTGNLRNGTYLLQCLSDKEVFVRCSVKRSVISDLRRKMMKIGCDNGPVTVAMPAVMGKDNGPYPCSLCVPRTYYYL